MANKIKVIESTNPIDTLLNTKCTNPFRSPGYVEVGDEKMCFPIFYQEHAQKYADFEVRNEDVFLCGFPKTGTTWVGELLWLLSNDLNYEKTTQEYIVHRLHHFELEVIYNVKLLKSRNLFDKDLPLLEDLDSKPNPRCIRTHFPWFMLPRQIQDGTKTPKIVVTLRNPEDSCLSYYHYNRGRGFSEETFQEYCDLFLAGRVSCGPYWKAVLSFWHERHRSNILFVRYEDMKKDLPGSIKRVADFLEKPITDEQLSKLAHHLSFEQMKDNPSVNYENMYAKAKERGTIDKDFKFMRSGKVGSHKEEMSDELIARFKEWTKENLKEEDWPFE